MSVRTFLNNFITLTQDFRFFSVFPLFAFKGGPFLKEMVKKAIERELDDIPHEGDLIEYDVSEFWTPSILDKKYRLPLMESKKKTD